MQYMLQFEDSYPLSSVTTLSIGGPAKKFVSVFSEEELIEAIRFAKKQRLSFLVIGSGSNLLVSDDGFEGLVIKNQISGIEQTGSIVKVKSGTVLKNLVDYSIQKALSGLQNLSGIPGTIGGAVYGNAGAYGQSISDSLVNIIALNPDTYQVSEFQKQQCGFAYRDSIFKRNRFIILEASFELTHEKTETLLAESRGVLAKRAVKYPEGIKCPGSFFKNLVAADLPPQILKNVPQDKIVFGKVPAGTLLEMVGAKGQCLENIEIAPYHANLFLNQGKGTAKAFYDLAKTYSLKVREKFGITLEPEVQLINLPPLI